MLIDLKTQTTFIDLFIHFLLIFQQYTSSGSWLCESFTKKNSCSCHKLQEKMCDKKIQENWTLISCYKIIFTIRIGNIF